VDAPREHEALEMKSMMKTLKVGEQAQFEYALMDEIVKLQEALEVNAVHTTKERAELQDKVDKVIAARSTSNAAAERMAEMEAAMQSAQQGELARIEQRRKESEDRMAAREKDAERVRKIEARKKEEQRLLAAQMHHETMAKAAEAERRNEEAKRKRDDAKNEALRARLAHEQQLNEQRNMRKASEASEKIMNASRMRQAQTAQAEAAFQVRMAAQTQRMDLLRQVQEQKAKDAREQSRQKRELMEQAQRQMRAREAEKRQSILKREASKDGTMRRQFDSLHSHRMLRLHEHEVQAAASRGRVERTMSDLQGKLDSLEVEQNERRARLDHFDNLRFTKQKEQQEIATRHSVHAAELANSMDRMRANMKNGSCPYAMPASFRRSLQTPELRQIVERADPSGTGVVTLDSLRRVLSDLGGEQAAEQGAIAASSSGGVGGYLKRIKSTLGSSSLPTLTSLPEKRPSQRDRLLDAFRSADTDASGTISKRELYKILEAAKLSGSGSQDFLRLFKGFDVNNDGNLSFEEFKLLADAMRN